MDWGWSPICIQWTAVLMYWQLPSSLKILWYMVTQFVFFAWTMPIVCCSCYYISSFSYIWYRGLLKHYWWINTFCLRLCLMYSSLYEDWCVQKLQWIFSVNIISVQTFISTIFTQLERLRLWLGYFKLRTPCHQNEMTQHCLVTSSEQPWESSILVKLQS